MNTTLLIMAAGIGSRFGTGIKQLEPVDDPIRQGVMNLHGVPVFQRSGSRPIRYFNYLTYEKMNQEKPKERSA